eukprot:m.5899 g.5899  ORF g.5899 m.5899 type:complete len:207 (+) comp3431_c0_seq1:157-777(+)
MLAHTLTVVPRSYLLISPLSTLATRQNWVSQSHSLTNGTNCKFQPIPYPIARTISQVSSLHNPNKHEKRKDPSKVLKDAEETIRKKRLTDAHTYAEKHKDDKVGERKAKIQTLVAKYGLPFLVIWTGLWGVSGAAIFGAAQAGIFEPMVVIDWIDGVFDSDLRGKIDPSWGNLAVAIVLNEAIEPLRFPVAVAVTPPILRMFGRGT